MPADFCFMEPERGQNPQMISNTLVLGCFHPALVQAECPHFSYLTIPNEPEIELLRHIYSYACISLLEDIGYSHFCYGFNIILPLDSSFFLKSEVSVACGDNPS